MNKVFLIGNLGKAPETANTTTGKTVAKFTVATQERKDDAVEWHNVVAWDKTAENCAKYLTKGAKVLVEGRIQSTSWDDPKTGQKRYKTEVVANNVQFLSKPEGATATAPKSNSAPDGLAW